MIESTYSVNNSKIAFVAHSMGTYSSIFSFNINDGSAGNLFFLTFLRTMTQEWKDKYVLTYIAVSPPWVGAIEAVQSLVIIVNAGSAII